MPMLKGYIATTEKETATVILRGPEEDPLLAAWQYGLGRAVAFTSDASARWAANWIGWDGYADFWSQAIRWTIIDDATSNVEARVVQRGDQTVVMVDARDTSGDYLNGLQLDASVINAQLQTSSLQLQQTAPGRYEAVFTPEDEGAYFVTVAGGTPETADSLAPQSVVQTAGWVLSYSSEYAVDVSGTGQQTGEALLAQIAGSTGGVSLRDRPDEVFLHNLDQEQAAQPVWPHFVLAALLLLVADVAVRRLVVTRTDLERARARIAGWVGAGPRAVPPVTEMSPRMSRLMDAKGRARSAGPSAEDQVPSERPMPRSELPLRRLARPRKSPPPPASPRDVVSKPPPPEGTTLASRLLERRQSSQRDQDDNT